MTTSPAITTHTVRTPGATITYDVRGEVGTGVPLLVFGSPMDASGFPTLAGHFPDRPVVTYDPRGTGRSTRDQDGESTPQQHAQDLAAIVEAIGGGPVDAFGSSGGAVNALAWAAARPEQLRTLVAHEPPLLQQLPDAVAARAAVADIGLTYQREGFGPGMVKFILLVGHEGEIAEGFRFPPVDPAQFGMPAQDDGRRDDPLLAQNLSTCTGYRLDVPALTTGGVRIVVARGEGSGRQFAARAAAGTADALGLPVTMFPGDHAGFLGGEYGQTGEPDAFAARLREVLGR